MAADDARRRNRTIPLLQGLLPIARGDVPGEIVAGLTLAALAVPEVMGYTKIAGTPVITGLYTLLVPAAVFAVFGSSRHLVVGADSATAAILAAGLAGSAAAGSAQYVALAALLALMAGGFLIVARLSRLGFLADFLSRTVLIGFLTGVGIQVALGQVAGMLGLATAGRSTLPAIWHDLRQLRQTNGYALTLALSVLVVVVGSRRMSKKIPGALIAVVGAAVASWALDLKAHVEVLGPLPRGLPHLGFPQVQWNGNVIGNLVPTAFAIFVVILTQSAATSRAYAMRYEEHFSEDTDLLGLALANLGAGLSGTFVVNGSPTKTQMLDSAGGRSQLSLAVTTVVVLLVLLFLTAPLANLPEAALSAVVFLIGLDLIDLAGMRRVFAVRRSEFNVALITAATVVGVGVEQGILLAIALSLVDHTRRGYRPRNLVLAPVGTGWQAYPVATHTQALPGLVVYHFTHSMYYANSAQLLDEATSLANSAAPPLRWFCIDAAAVDDVDYTASDTLRAIHETLAARGVRLVVAQVIDDVGRQSGDQLRQLFGADAFYDTLDDVLRDYQRYIASTAR
jgi:SulP family sulfate permease